MPFFGVEDTFPMHPKVVAAGNAAIGAWLRMGCHCVGHGTNGFISEKEAKIFATPGQITKLLQCVVSNDGVGLLEEAELNGVKGYFFHDWTQPEVETIRHRREVRAAAGRKGGLASAASKAAEKISSSKHFSQAFASASAQANASASAQASAQANGKQNSSTEDKDIDLTTPVSALTYVSNAPAHLIAPDDFDEATSERGSQLSGVVNVGASRLVATIIRDGIIGDADRVILRLKASEAIHSGRSEEDVAECLRIWITKNELGPHALLCCMSEVDKRKINGIAGNKIPTSDLRVIQGEELKKRIRNQMVGEIESGR